MSHKPGGRLTLLSARPAVTLTTLKKAATNFAVWWTEAQWVWTVCLKLVPNSVTAAIWTQALLCQATQHDYCNTTSESYRTVAHLSGVDCYSKSLECWQFLKTNHSFQLSLVQPVDLWQWRHLAALFATHQVEELRIICWLTATTTHYDTLWQLVFRLDSKADG